jgi:hypothetical protein
MNDQNPNPPGEFPGLPSGTPGANPPIIPAAWPPTPPGSAQTLGANPSERAPISGVLGAIEAILRQPRRVMFNIKEPNPGGLITALLAIAVTCSLVYGIIVGTFSGAEQYWAAPVKIAIGLILSTLICLPSLYIFSCLGGSQARLVEVFGLVSGLLAIMTILLIGFAPVAWVFSQSTKSVFVMGILHLAFWSVATTFGLRFLLAGFTHFNTRSFAGLQVWIAVFVMVAMQMTTALRPIIGRADTFLPAAGEKKFFVNYWMDCADSDATNGRQSAQSR